MNRRPFHYPTNRPAADPARMPLALIGMDDPDATAYIAAIVANGATVTAANRKAINQFFKTGKLESWYSLIKRLYLPIWGIQSANEICLVSRESGSFTASGVTHAAGYVQGNGSTGSFSTGKTSADLQMSIGSRFFLLLTYQKSATKNCVLGVRDDAINRALFGSEIAGTGFYASGTAIALRLTGAVDGILIASDTSSSGRFLLCRKTSGVTTLSETTPNTTTVPTGAIYAMAYNDNGVATGHSNASESAWGFGTSLSVSQATALSSAIKTLWETCTGLTLP